jgi:hypothetical protein
MRITFWAHSMIEFWGIADLYDVADLADNMAREMKTSIIGILNGLQVGNTYPALSSPGIFAEPHHTILRANGQRLAPVAANGASMRKQKYHFKPRKSPSARRWWRPLTKTMRSTWTLVINRVPISTGPPPHRCRTRDRHVLPSHKLLLTLLTRHTEGKD